MAIPLNPSRPSTEGAASIAQVERLIRADIDAGRIHRLTVGERPVQIEAAIAGLRQFSRRLLAGFHRAEHFLPVCRARLGRLQLDKIGFARVRHRHYNGGRARRCLRLGLGLRRSGLHVSRGEVRLRASQSERPQARR